MPAKRKPRVLVVDDRPGLGADQTVKIFERFYRCDPSRSRHHGGAGLGLAIVDAVGRAHGGAVSGADGDAGGAVFTISLPCSGDLTTSQLALIPACAGCQDGRVD